MPITINNVTDSPVQGENILILTDAIPDGEMADNDFAQVNGNFFDATFDNRVQWVASSTELAELSNRLLSFLETAVTGPFYVHEAAVNARVNLTVFLFDEEDIAAFAAEFPDWEYDTLATGRNMGRIRQNIQAGWKPESQRLKDFCFTRGLCAPLADGWVPPSP